MNGAFHDFLSALARVSIQVFVGAHIRIHCWDSPCFLAVSKNAPSRSNGYSVLFFYPGI